MPALYRVWKRATSPSLLYPPCIHLVSTLRVYQRLLTLRARENLLAASHMEVRMPIFNPSEGYHPELYRSVMTLYEWARQNIMLHPDALVRAGREVADPFQDQGTGPKRGSKRKAPWLP